MITLPCFVQDFLDNFKNNGFQIYIVGGAVRDLIMNRDLQADGINWDFASNATPEEILKLYPDAFYNNKYGTVTIPFTVETGHAPSLQLKTKTFLFEVTPFRKESQYKDFRHPQKIEWASTIEEDLARRDFTINAIAYDGKNIIDPFHGRKHIEEKVIVAVGVPDNRFKEDALRLLIFLSV